jgi:hypothetical protein
VDISLPQHLHCEVATTAAKAAIMVIVLGPPDFGKWSMDVRTWDSAPNINIAKNVTWN